MVFGTSQTGSVVLVAACMLAAGLYSRYRLVQAFHADGVYRSLPMYGADLVSVLGGLTLLGLLVSR